MMKFALRTTFYKKKIYWVNNVTPNFSVLLIIQKKKKWSTSISLLKYDLICPYHDKARLG